jgi:Zn-dependent protease
MKSSIKMGRILGIPIHLHFSFLLILPLFVYAFSVGSDTILWARIGFGDLGGPEWIKYAWGTAAAVLFFATILVHELAHSYVALRFGVRIKSITLMLFGGIAAMEEVPKKPLQELKMALAGPMSSLAIGLASFGGMLLVDAAMDPSVAMDGLTILLGLMSLYNVILAGFNLLPAFPMDGGRVLRSALATRMTYLEATRNAARIGRYSAVAMGVFGLITGNIWLIIIAFFVYFGATEEEQSTIVSESLTGLKVGHIMSAPVMVVHPEMSVQQLLDMIFATRHTGFPVTAGGLVGVVTLTDAQKVPRDRLHEARVGDIMTRQVVTVEPVMDAEVALHLMSERRIGRLVVVHRGQLVGIVTKKDFLRAVDVVKTRGAAFGPYPPPPPPPSEPSPPAASS